MKGITWTQVAQYWVLITAFLVPAIAISIQLTGNSIPSVGLCSDLQSEGMPLLAKLDQVSRDLGFSSYTEPFVGDWSQFDVVCTALALMAGTAGLPHVIVRFYTVKNVAAARWSGFWALLFISALYLTAPATAAFARWHLIDSLHGKTEAVAAAPKAPDAKVAALLQKGACISCHGDNFNKPIDPSYPKLAGQHKDFLYVALKSYKTENLSTWGRNNGVMGGIAKQFSNAELKAMSAYIGSLDGEMRVIPQSRLR
jgi:cytochrome c553